MAEHFNRGDRVAMVDTYPAYSNDNATVKNNGIIGTVTQVRHEYGTPRVSVGWDNGVGGTYGSTDLETVKNEAKHKIVADLKKQLRAVSKDITEHDRIIEQHQSARTRQMDLRSELYQTIEMLEEN